VHCGNGTGRHWQRLEANTSFTLSLLPWIIDSLAMCWLLKNSGGLTSRVSGSGRGQPFQNDGSAFERYLLKAQSTWGDSKNQKRVGIVELGAWWWLVLRARGFVFGAACRFRDNKLKCRASWGRTTANWQIKPLAGKFGKRSSTEKVGATDHRT
jgi:hypothetical protein